MRSSKLSGNHGFTLIEIVAVLVLISIATIFTGMLITTTLRVYTHSRDSAVDSQKVQVAMNRLIKELTWVQTLEAPDTHTIEWRSSHPDREDDGLQTASFHGNAIHINENILMTGIHSFDATMSGNYIELKLRTERAPAIEQVTRVYPRYMEFQPDLPTS